MKGRKMTDTMLKNAVDTINYWYDRLGQAIDANDETVADEFSNKYENAIEYYARKLNMREAKLEDIATDVRYLGWEMC